MDIIIYPHKTKETKPTLEILSALFPHGLNPMVDEPGSCSDKEVWVGRTARGRADFFFLK